MTAERITAAAMAGTHWFTVWLRADERAGRRDGLRRGRWGLDTGVKVIARGQRANHDRVTMGSIARSS